MTSLLTATALLLFLLFCLLLLGPVRLGIGLCKRGTEARGEYKVSWLGLPIKRGALNSGAIKRSEIGAYEKDGADEKPGAEVRKEPAVKPHGAGSAAMPSGPESRSSPPRARTLISAVPAGAEILFDLLGEIRLRNFSCRICFGLDDPADTAALFGSLWACIWTAGLVSPTISAGLFMEPYFEGERLEGELEAELEGRPVHALTAAFQALRVRETRMLLKETTGWAW